MYDHILVPLDGSERAERAIPPARELAQRTDAVLDLVTCTWSGDPLVPRIEAHDYLAELSETLKPLTVDRLVPSDREPGEAIAVLAEERAPALVCMTSHGRSGLGQALLGSVAESTVRHLASPILLFGPHAPPTLLPLEHAFVAVDGSPASRGVARTAMQWAELFGLAITLVHVIDPDDVERARAAGVETGAEADVVHRLAQELATPTVSPAWDVLHGDDPAEALLSHARDSERSLLFAGTHGRSGLPRLVLGSVAMRLVRHAEVPVVLRPPSASDPD